jgi:adhesin/invasin
MSLLRPKHLAAFLAVIGLACSGDGGGPQNGPTTIAATGGDNQVAAAGSQLATPLSVRITDQAGAAVAGVVVNWAAASGGGSVSAATSTTAADGIATMSRTLGPNAGTQTTTATHSGLTGSPVVFTAIAQIQGAIQIALAASSSGNGQQDTVKSTLANPYRVLVRDQINTPVQNVIVDWTVTGGGGSVSAAKDTTDAAGIAVVTHTFGTAAGAQTVQASVVGLVGSPVTFTSTATAGVAASVEIAAGNNQTGMVNNAVATAYGVRAKDSYGNPKQGVTINWAVQAGTGSLNPTQSVTAANGIATSTRTLGANSGTFTDTATATLSGSPLLFTVNATTAPATASVDVGASGNTFSPDSVLIALNGTVTFAWASAVTHNVTFTTANAPANIGNNSSGSFPRQFTTAGTFNYHCTIHGGMTGKVVVVP